MEDVCLRTWELMEDIEELIPGCVWKSIKRVLFADNLENNWNKYYPHHTNSSISSMNSLISISASPSPRASITSVNSPTEFVNLFSSYTSQFSSISPILFYRIELTWSSLRFWIWLSPISIGIGSGMNPQRKLPHWIILAIDDPNAWSYSFY